MDDFTKSPSRKSFVSRILHKAGEGRVNRPAHLSGHRFARNRPIPAAGTAWYRLSLRRFISQGGGPHNASKTSESRDTAIWRTGLLDAARNLRLGTRNDQSSNRRR